MIEYVVKRQSGAIIKKLRLSDVLAAQCLPGGKSRAEVLDQSRSIAI